MSIDMIALRAAATGDQDAQVSVNRRWLGAVHRRLLQAEVDASALAILRRDRQRTGGHDVLERVFTKVGLAS